MIIFNAVSLYLRRRRFVNKLWADDTYKESFRRQRVKQGRVKKFRAAESLAVGWRFFRFLITDFFTTSSFEILGNL